MAVKRQWYVHGTPIKGYHPDGATLDLLTGNANKMVVGPFVSVVAAAIFVNQERPVETWRQVGILSNVSKAKK